MTSKKHWDSLVWKFLSSLNEIKAPHSCKILKEEFLVLPGVFSPAKSSDTEWYAQILMPYIKEKTFLEIGSGCGAISCLALLKGAIKAVATDINPQCIQNIKLNAERFDLDLDIRQGDVFDPLHENEKFDVIFWNHPFNYLENNYTLNFLEKSVFDPGYESLEKFFCFAKNHISSSGQIFLGTSSVARIRMLKILGVKYGYRLLTIATYTSPVYKTKRQMMDLRLYSLLTSAL